MTVRRARWRRRAGVIGQGAVVASLTVALGSCFTETSTVAPVTTFKYPVFITPPVVTVTTVLDPAFLIPVDPAPPATLTEVPAAPPAATTTTTTTTTAPPQPALPPTCQSLLAAIEVFTGPAGSPGGEEYDAAGGHEYARCYGTVLPVGDAAAGARSATFEIWSYPSGTYPAGLVEAGSPFTEPSAFAGDASFDASIIVTAPDFTRARDISNARRAARFPCGSFECWMYLEEGTSFPADEDTSTLDSHIAGVAQALRDAGEPAGPVSTSTTAPVAPVVVPTKPTCAELAKPIDTILSIFGVSAESRSTGAFPDDASHDYVGCYGSFGLTPPSGVNPNPSSRDVAYQIWAITPGHEPDFLGLEAADQPAAALGDGVTSNGGSLTIVRSGTVPENDKGITLMHNSVYDFNFYRLGGGGEPYDLRVTDARRTIRFSCGSYECYVVLAETAYAPPDPDLTLIDAQLKIFIAATRAYMQAL